MPQGFAFKPWTAFSRQSDWIFQSGFYQGNMFTFRTRHRPMRGIVKFKTMIAKEKQRIQTQRISVNSQLKLWFPLNNKEGAFSVRIRDQDLKVQYEHGVKDYGGNLIDFYGGLQTQQKASRYIAKIGANLLRLNSNFDNRLRFAWNQLSTEPQISSAHKVNWSFDKWEFDWCSIINLRNSYKKAFLFSNSARIIFRPTKKDDIFFKAQNKSDVQTKARRKMNIISPSYLFTHFAVDYVRTIDQVSKCGLQLQFTKDNVLSASVVGQLKYRQNSKKIKVKFQGMSKTFSLSHQTLIKNYGKWVFGWQIERPGSQNNVKFGLLIDLNL